MQEEANPDKHLIHLILHLNKLEQKDHDPVPPMSLKLLQREVMPVKPIFL